MVSRRYPETANKPQETTLIVQPDVYSGQDSADRTIEQKIEEIQSLTKAINLVCVKTITCNVSRIQAGYFLGKGKRQEIADLAEELEPNIIVFNYILSPVQQRNLEKEWNCKVIDRTGLILEIFGARAQTKEGRLQVELASMEYQKSRLVRSWTHLERQRGGAGFMGGPGETQIELDRRIIGERITKLKKEIEAVKKTRDLGRKSRARVPFPVVALVGYTNAGKSTFFNRLTGAKVFAKDLLFATLDPTLRRIELPNGQNVILSDTVGFISDLPTHLIAAFRATLEETLHAEVIVHMIDVSREDWDAQRNDVIQILESLGIEYESDSRIIEVYNKIDNLNKEDRAEILRKAKFNERVSALSALKGEGEDQFYQKITDILSNAFKDCSFELELGDGKALAWLYEHSDVLNCKHTDLHVEIDVLIDPANLSRFIDGFGYQPIKNN